MSHLCRCGKALCRRLSLFFFGFWRFPRDFQQPVSPFLLGFAKLVHRCVWKVFSLSELEFSTFPPQPSEFFHILFHKVWKTFWKLTPFLSSHGFSTGPTATFLRQTHDILRFWFCHPVKLMEFSRLFGGWFRFFIQKIAHSTFPHDFSTWVSHTLLKSHVEKSNELFFG